MTHFLGVSCRNNCGTDRNVGRAVPVLETLPPQLWVASRGHVLPGPDRFVPVRVGSIDKGRGYPWMKPDYSTGMWTSTLTKWRARPWSDWLDWCRGEQFGDRRVQGFALFLPTTGLKIFQIDTEEDLIELVERFPHEPEEPFRGPSIMGRFPHWQNVMEVYDAVTLTREGQWATRMPDLHYRPKKGETQVFAKIDDITELEPYNFEKYRSMMERLPNLYGWDCESTLWGKWAFEHVEPLGEIRVHNHDHSKDKSIGELMENLAKAHPEMALKAEDEKELEIGSQHT